MTGFKIKRDDFLFLATLDNLNNILTPGEMLYILETGKIYSKQNTEAIMLNPDAPTQLSEMDDDSSHRLVTDADKTAWNLKADATQPGWNAVTLLNSWVNAGAPFSDAGYFKDTIGNVHLRGVIKNGSVTAGTTLFVLPVGFRPSSSLILSAISKGTEVVQSPIIVDTSGNVTINESTFNAWLSLDGITFKI